MHWTCAELWRFGVVNSESWEAGGRGISTLWPGARPNRGRRGRRRPLQPDRGRFRTPQPGRGKLRGGGEEDGNVGQKEKRRQASALPRRRWALARKPHYCTQV